MRSKIDVTTVYKFNELDTNQQDKAIEGLWDINVDHDWYESVYEDAENIGLKITEFDIDRHQINGTFETYAELAAHKIIAEHGENCETYKDAQTYLKDLAKLTAENESANNLRDEDDYNDIDTEDLDTEFEHTFLEDYLIMLRKDYEYLTGRESIIETIKSNEYEFTAEGELA
jgi:hypothetical protein